MAAALSSTEGTDCSRASVPFARGTRWGLRGCGEGDGREMGSMSRSKMAEEEECLGTKHVIHTSNNDRKRKTHTQKWARMEWSRENESPVDGQLYDCALWGGGRE